MQFVNANMKHGRLAARSAGYSLMELLITVAIIAIIAAVAMPNYQQHVLRSHRGDAMTALLRIAAQQEKFYLQNNTYTGSLADVNTLTTEAGYYQLSIDAADTDTFTATATAIAGKAQESDADCQTFSITAEGTRTASGGGSDTSDVCWR